MTTFTCETCPIDGELIRLCVCPCKWSERFDCLCRRMYQTRATRVVTIDRQIDNTTRNMSLHPFRLEVSKGLPRPSLHDKRIVTSKEVSQFVASVAAWLTLFVHLDHDHRQCRPGQSGRVKMRKVKKERGVCLCVGLQRLTNQIKRKQSIKLKLIERASVRCLLLVAAEKMECRDIAIERDQLLQKPRRLFSVGGESRRWRHRRRGTRHTFECRSNALNSIEHNYF
jgi:hypothetical protein